MFGGSYKAGKYAGLQIDWSSNGGPAVDLSEGGLNDRFRFATVNLPVLIISAADSAYTFTLRYDATEVSGTDVDISFDSFTYVDRVANTTRAATAADFAGVQRLQWNLALRDGSQFSQDRAFSAGTFAAVPAPSAAALMGLASLGALRRRR
jgi:hypothetical protein